MKEWLAEIDSLIRQGRSREARKALEARLQDRARAPLPRERLAEIADLCRRSGLYDSVIRLLNPVVRPTGRKAARATPAELVAYGAALIQIGAVREGLDVLAGVDPATQPQTLLFSAFAHMGQWDYASALPLLERYEAHPRLERYPRQVASANIAECLVVLGRLERAAALARELAEAAGAEGNRFLRGHALMTEAQAFVAAGEWARAESVLRRAEAESAEVETFDAIHVRKWKAVIALHRRPGRGSEEALARVRVEALDRRNWETVRDCDFQLASVRGDEELFRRLFHGTPYPAYRRRVESEAGRPLAAANGYLWRLGGHARRAVPAIDVLLGRFEGPGGASLKAGQVPQRLLALLASDLYRPRRLASLFAELFPGRFYNASTAPNVVHQALRRLRGWLDVHGIPLSVLERKGEYFLDGSPACALRLRVQEPGARAAAPGDVAREARLAACARRIREAFGSEAPLTRESAARALGCSQRSANRALVELVEAGLAARVGEGRATRYRLLAG